MCVVSMIMEHGLHQPYDFWKDQENVRRFNDLMDRAKKYDIENDEPDCELDEKRQALKKIADELGIEIKFV